MKRIKPDGRLADTINRRVHMAPEYVLEKALGFTSFDLRLWVDEDMCMLAIGRHAFIRSADKNNEKTGTPFPELLTKQAETGYGVAISITNCLFGRFENLAFTGFPRSFRLVGISSFYIKNLRYGADKNNMRNIDLLIVERFTSEVDMFAFAETADALLSKVFEDHVRIDLHAA